MAAASDTFRLTEEELRQDPDTVFSVLGKLGEGYVRTSVSCGGGVVCSVAGVPCGFVVLTGSPLISLFTIPDSLTPYPSSNPHPLL